MGLMFSVVPALVTIGFIVVFGLIIASLIKGGMEWHSNNNSPVLTVNAKIITKRAEVSHSTSHHHAGHDTGIHHSSSSSTTYYAAFEVESGDRMEFRLPGKEYGLLAEGDTGKLTFQGTRYHGFERDITPLQLQ